MSKYNHYAKELDALARSNFQKYQSAKAAFESAKKDYEANKRPAVGVWMATPERMIAAANAEVRYFEAKDAWENVQRAYMNSVDEAMNIRNKLESAIGENNRAKSSDMDGNAIELLKSGILAPKEYEAMLNDFKGNPTMVRMIGSYAENSAREAEARGDHDARRTLAAVSFNSKQMDGRNHLEAFDFLADVYSRSVKNPGMIEHWDSLTSEAVESF